MSVAELQELEEVKGLVTRGQQVGVLSYAEIARLEFTGKDRAAGKHWEDWVEKYNAKKAAGERNIALVPESLD